MGKVDRATHVQSRRTVSSGAVQIADEVVAIYCRIGSYGGQRALLLLAGND